MVSDRQSSGLTRGHSNNTLLLYLTGPPQGQEPQQLTSQVRICWISSKGVLFRVGFSEDVEADS